MGQRTYEVCMLLLDQIKHSTLACQEEIFSELDASLGPLSGRYKLFILALEMVLMEDFLPSQSRGSRGRPLSHRTSIAKAFFARMIFQIPTTTALRERLLMDRTLRSLCGWPRGCDVPSEPAFSRLFHEFSESELPTRIHETLIKSCYEDQLLGHISRPPLAINVLPLLKICTSTACHLMYCFNLYHTSSSSSPYSLSVNNVPIPDTSSEVPPVKHPRQMCEKLPKTPYTYQDTEFCMTPWASQ